METLFVLHFHSFFTDTSIIARRKRTFRINFACCHPYLSFTLRTLLISLDIIGHLTLIQFKLYLFILCFSFFLFLSPLDIYDGTDIHFLVHSRHLCCWCCCSSDSKRADAQLLHTHGHPCLSFTSTKYFLLVSLIYAEWRYGVYGIMYRYVYGIKAFLHLPQWVPNWRGFAFRYLFCLLWWDEHISGLFHFVSCFLLIPFLLLCLSCDNCFHLTDRCVNEFFGFAELIHCGIQQGRICRIMFIYGDLLQLVIFQSAEALYRARSNNVFFLIAYLCITRSAFTA